jgi:hypothetical protein
MFDTLTNVADFYAANLGFSIQDCDAQFEEDGELSGYRTVENTRYRPGGGERTTWDNCLLREVIVDQDPEREVFIGEGIEDNALLDDGPAYEGDEYLEVLPGQAFKSAIPKARCVSAARWDHERDAYESSELDRELLLSQRDRLFNPEGKRLPMHGEHGFWALDRHRRYRRLARFIEAQDAKDRKAKRQRRKGGHVARARKAIWARYKQSVAECAESGDWSRVLLTKAQVTWLMARCNWR